MKTKLTLLMALAGLFTLTAGAQDNPPRPGGREGGRNRQPDDATIKKYDKDGDGKLNEAERTAWRTARDEERKAEMLAKYDADKNGKLDEAETKKMETENPRRGGSGGPGGRGQYQPTAEDIKKYDKDGDGQLSREERTALREDRQKEMTAKYDADKDGKLNDEETAKMREDLRKERESRPAGGGTRPDGTKPDEKKPEEKPTEPSKGPVPQTK